MEIYRKGMPVVCIRRAPWKQVAGPDDYSGKLPKYGEVYLLSAAAELDGVIWVCLDEVPNARFEERNFMALNQIERVAKAICLEMYGNEHDHGDSRCCQAGGLDGCCLDAVKPVAIAAIGAMQAGGANG